MREFLEQLAVYKGFHESLKATMQREFGLSLQENAFRDFVLANLRRFVPLRLFVQKHARPAGVSNTTSTARLGSQHSVEDARTGDFTLTIDR